MAGLVASIGWDAAAVRVFRRARGSCAPCAGGDEELRGRRVCAYAHGNHALFYAADCSAERFFSSCIRPINLPGRQEMWSHSRARPASECQRLSRRAQNRRPQVIRQITAGRSLSSSRLRPWVAGDVPVFRSGMGAPRGSAGSISAIFSDLLTFVFFSCLFVFRLTQKEPARETLRAPKGHAIFRALIRHLRSSPPTSCLFALVYLPLA